MEPVVYSRARAASLFSSPQRVYAFYGEDDRQKDEAIALLRAACVDEAVADFDVETIDADTRDADAILAAVSLVPLGEGRRLVVVRGAELLRRRERSADTEKLAAGLARIGASSVLALRVAAEGGEDRKAKTVLTAKLDKAVTEHGVLVQCRSLSDEDLVAWLQEEAKSVGKRLEADGALRLVRTGRGDRRVLRNELEKVICYSGPAQRITAADVDKVASYDPEDVMFRLVDAVCQREASRALSLLHELLRYDTKPQNVAARLLALLGRQFRLLWQARELAGRGIGPTSLRNLPADVAADLPSDGSIVAMAWRARDIYAAARAWRRDQLTEAMGMLVECDLANKGGETGSEDLVTNLELLLARLCRPS